jgi:predicted RND superfamily exporter protein
MLDGFMKKYVGFAYRNTLTLFLIFVLIFGFAIYFVKNKFVVDSDLAAMFEGSNENVKRLKKVTERIGTFETFLVVSKSDSFEKNLEFMEDLAKRIKKLKEVESVELKKETDYIEKHAMLFVPLEELEENLKIVNERIAGQVKDALSIEEKGEKPESAGSSEFRETIENIKKKALERKKRFDLQPYFTTDDGTFLAMKVRPTGNDTDAKNLIKVIAAIQNSIDETVPSHPGVQVEIGGELLHKVNEVKSLNKDLLFTIILCVVLLSLIIIWYFRSFAALLIVMFPLSAGILSAVTITILIIKVFNIVSAFSFVILYGLGIDFGIHLLSRYGEKKEEGQSAADCMAKTVSDVFPSIISGALTTAAAFLTIYFIDFKGFSDYGLVAFIGIVTSLFAYFFFFPVFVFALEKARDLKIRPRKITLLEKLYLSFLKEKKKVLAFSLFLTVLSVFAFFNIPFEYDLMKLSYKIDEGHENSIVAQYKETIGNENRDSRSRGRVAIYLTDSREDAGAVAAILNEMKRSGSDDGKLEAVFSIKSFLPDDQQEKLRVIKRIKRTIERKIELFSTEDRELLEKEIMPFLSVESEISEEFLPDWAKAMLSEKDGALGNFVIAMISGNYKDMRTVSETKEKFGTLKHDGKEFKMTAPFLLLADVDEIINRDVPVMALFAMIVVIVTLLIMFRSFHHAVSLFIPLTVAVIWMFGAAWLFDIRFNLFNMIIVPTMIGTGIDSSIHIFDRFLKSGFDRFAIPEILNRTGGAVFFSSLTTLIGFFSLVFSSHQGMVSIGMIASLGIIMATLVNLTIFPLVMGKGKGK